MLIGGQGDLYLWEAVDRTGKRQKYQTHGPNVTEAAMLDFLRRKFPGLRIVALRRSSSPASEYIPPRPDELGNVKTHAFDFGVRRNLAQQFREMGEHELQSMAAAARRYNLNDPGEKAAAIAVAVAIDDAKYPDELASTASVAVGTAATPATKQSKQTIVDYVDRRSIKDRVNAMAQPIASRRGRAGIAR